MMAMTDAQMRIALAALPDPDLLQTSNIDDPIGSDVFYSGRTVVELLARERERFIESIGGMPGPT